MEQEIKGPTYLSLETPPGRAPDEKRLDGNSAGIATPSSPGKAEFPATTEVVYINGINTTYDRELADATKYADLIHAPVRLIHAATDGMASDLETCALEKFGFANNPPERAVVSEVLKHIQGAEFRGDIHFMAHSRGALVLQRGLEMLEQRLGQEHLSKSEIKVMMSHISVETVGGASVGMPSGVRCVNYVNAHDSVANVFGMGTPSGRDIAELIGLSAALGPIAGTVLEAKVLSDRENVRPNGPVVPVPPVHPERRDSQYTDLLENHNIDQYLAHRQPFERTYERWQHHSVGKAIEDLGQRGHRLPTVTSVEGWNGHAVTGTVVALGDGDHAIHVGRGKYMTFDAAHTFGTDAPIHGAMLRVGKDGIIEHDGAASVSR